MIAVWCFPIRQELYIIQRHQCRQYYHQGILEGQTLWIWFYLDLEPKFPDLGQKVSIKCHFKLFFRLCNKSVKIILHLMGNEQHSSCREYLGYCQELQSLQQYGFLNLLISVLCKTCEQFFDNSEPILLTWMSNKTLSYQAMDREKELYSSSSLCAVTLFQSKNYNHHLNSL